MVIKTIVLTLSLIFLLSIIFNIFIAVDKVDTIKKHINFDDADNRAMDMPDFKDNVFAENDNDDGYDESEWQKQNMYQEYDDDLSI